MAEQVNGIGLDVDNGLFEVGATLPQAGSWSIGCDVTIEDVDASVQEVRVNDISLSGSLAIPEVSVDIDANNDKVMDLEIGIAASGLSTGITESQIVPYDKIVKITEFSPESINERKYASSALAAKRIYDLIKEGGAGLNEDELKAFLKRYGYVTEEYVNELLKNVSSFFYLSEDGQSIGTPYNIFSEKEISANGLSVGSGGSGGGEGGGLIRNVLSSSSLGSVTSNDNFTTFNAFAIDSIYKKVKSIEEGGVSLSNYYTKSESDARFALLSSLTTVEEKIREILSWFKIDENGNLRTELNLYSTKEISAGGFNGAGGSTGGGLISTVLGIEKFGTVTTNSNTATFNAYAIDSLHKRIKSIEESEVDLTGYATEEWVMGRGFITANSLTPYLKTTDFESWKTSSFSPVASQVNTNKNNIAEILKWFAIDGDGNLYTTYNFYSTKEISSGGFDSGSNGTGGLIGVVYGKSSFGTIANEANNATFNAYAIDSLYKRIVSLENKEVDLTSYATEAWVAGQGFITSAALSPYMKTADANDTFATKTALNNLSGNHDSLAARVSTAEGNISANATAITNLGKRVTANEVNIAEILKWFAVDSDGNLYTTYNFYSTKEISANGLSIGSGGSGDGLISQVFGTTAFGTIASESNSATFNAYAIDSLYKRIVSLEGKATAVSFVPALTSGKQIGALSIDGVSTVLYAPAGYAWSEVSGKPTLIESEGVAVDGSPKVNRFGLWQGKGAYWSIGHDSNYVIQAYANVNGVYLRSLTGGTDSGWKRILREGDAYSKTDADGTFLKQSGGTISGSSSGILTINRTSGTPLIAFQANGTNVGFLGIDTVSRPCFVDPVYYETSYLIHSGNIGSQFVEGIATVYANKSIDLGREGKVRMIYGTASDATSLGYPRQYTSGLSVLTGYTGWQMVTYGGTSIPNPYFRSLIDNGSFSDWKQLAFLTDNVASATKLATARTIWGQSFDGSGNVSGNITLGAASIRGYDNRNILESTANDLMIGYGYTTSSLKTTIFGNTIKLNDAVLINSSGNVTIGSSDTAGTSYKLDVNGNIKGVNIFVAENKGMWLGSQFTASLTSDDLAIVGSKVWFFGDVSARNNLETRGTFAASGAATFGSTLSVANALTVATNVQIPINGDRITFCSATGTYTKGILAMNTSNTYLEAPLATDSASGAKPAIMIGWRGCSAATGTTKPYPITITSGEIALNGTTAINGTLKNVNNIYPNSAGERYIGTSTNPFKYMYAEWYGAGTGQTLSFGANNATHIWVDTSGRVGIGTYDPQYKLDVNGTARVTGAVTLDSTLAVKNILRVNDASMNAILNIANEGGTINYVHLFVSSANSSNATTRPLVLQNGYGNVGIGINDPQYKLHVNGTARVSGDVSMGSTLNVTGLLTAHSGVKVASGQALTFLDASGKEHKLTYDSTAGAFKFDGNILVLGDGQFNAIN